jgi:hypothetical protein
MTTPPTGSAPLRHGVVDLDVGLDRPVRAILDTAGTQLCLSEWLVEALDLTVDERLEQQGSVVSSGEPPTLSIGGYELDTDGLVAYGFEDTLGLGLAARGADLLLPAPVLRRHAVVVDLAAGELTIGDAGSLERRGLVVPSTFDPSGQIVAHVQIEDGGVVELVLDTALPCSLAVDGVLRRWQSEHPDWPASLAAVGPGNVSGHPAEARIPMVRVPAVRWAGFTMPSVAFAWRGDADLGSDGALGAGALSPFRIELDYAGKTVRLEQGAPFPDPDADLVGVVLGLTADGWEVTAAVTGLDEVRAGDVLMAVDGEPIKPLTLPEVLDLLRGEPGERRHLHLRRGMDAVEVDAPVLRLL